MYKVILKNGKTKEFDPDLTYITVSGERTLNIIDRKTGAIVYATSDYLEAYDTNFVEGVEQVGEKSYLVVITGNINYLPLMAHGYYIEGDRGLVFYDVEGRVINSFAQWVAFFKKIKSGRSGFVLLGVNGDLNSNTILNVATLIGDIYKGHLIDDMLNSRF